MSYPEPNYTQTPNLLLDKHLPEMGCAEAKVVLALVRKTFGWHQRSDVVSISQLMEMTGLSNRGVIDGLRDAMERGVVARKEAGQSYEYWLAVDESGERGSQGCEDFSQGCEDSSQVAVSEAHTQKKKKETNQKENISRAREKSEAVKAYEDIFPRELRALQAERVEQKVDDLETWRAVLEWWSMNGYRAKSVGKMLNKYRQTNSPDELYSDHQGEPEEEGEKPVGIWE